MGGVSGDDADRYELRLIHVDGGYAKAGRYPTARKAIDAGRSYWMHTDYRRFVVVDRRGIEADRLMPCTLFPRVADLPDGDR